MPSWKDLFRKRAEDWTFLQLAASQVPADGGIGALAANSHYLSITLKSARVVNVRKGLSRFYGAVHSFVAIPHRAGQRASFQVVTTPANLKNVDAKNIDRVIQLDHRLVGPIPYRGGELEMEIGLFSIKAVDLAAPYLTLLESMGKLGGISFISAALPFAQPLATGVDLLLGAEDASVLEIGVAASAWKPELGYFAVIRASKGTIDATKLRVTPVDYRLVDADGNPVRDYPYLVFKVEASADRPDWFLIPELHEPYQQLQAAVREDAVAEVKEFLSLFRRTALTCPDLLTADARRLVELVTEETNAVMTETPTSKPGEGLERSLPELQEIPLFA